MNSWQGVDRQAGRLLPIEQQPPSLTAPSAPLPLHRASPAPRMLPAHQMQAAWSRLILLRGGRQVLASSVSGSSVSARAASTCTTSAAASTAASRTILALGHTLPPCHSVVLHMLKPA